jgi:hypothetical protein
VGGEVRATAQHGQVDAEDVAGGVFAETTHAGVSLERVDGEVQGTVDHGGIEARSLSKGAKLRATGGDVSLDGFTEPVEVEVERGGALLAPRAPVASAITATVTNGEVRLDVPEGSRFDLDAEAKRGEAQAEIPGLAVSTKEGEPGRGHRVAGKLGDGGPTVRLRADGDVVLQTKSAGAIADRPVAKPATATPAPPPEAPPVR